VRSADSLKQRHILNVSSAAADITLVFIGLMDMCNIRSLWPFSSATLTSDGYFQIFRTHFGWPCDDINSLCSVDQQMEDTYHKYFTKQIKIFTGDLAFID
jgi:hypothetical protein